MARRSELYAGLLGLVYLLAMPVIASAQSICASVPAASSAGVSFGNVIAGQTYAYQASGCAQRSSDNPNVADPDGNQYTNTCAAANFIQVGTAPAGATCPGLTLFSLVGKINGGPCLQLGKSGTFVAPSSGNLVLYFNDDNYFDNSGSWSVCLTPVQEMCTNVPAAASAGVAIGAVVAGQTYTYVASGCIQRSSDNPNMADPDGNQYTNTCAQSNFIQSSMAPAGATCPGLTLFSLVGKINGGPCIQLGKSGSFVAAASGTLVLYCNDDNYSDNSGSWNVCLTPVQQTCLALPASASAGVFVGDVVAGQTYTYQASGCIQRSSDNPNMADPDGNQYTNGCSAAQFVTNNVPAPAGATCPGLTLFSLVGKINGSSCLQLGKGGSFVAPSSGALVVYCNDDNYSDNSGSWNVCIDVAPAAIVSQVCQSVAAAASGGIIFGNVVAGQTYSYTAAGCVQRSSDNPNMADPDGNQYTNGCTLFITNNVPAPAGATCPGLTLFSLVAKIGGGPCLQLGKSGSFVASSSGQLVLYFNDDNYSDNSGLWNVCVAPSEQMCTNLPAAAAAGVIIGNVVAGQTYAYTASGCAQRSSDNPNLADPDGNQYFGNCSTFITNNIIAGGGATCPGLTLFSLVGKINGGSCIQLGKNGVFTATTSGPLTIYFNDDNYSDNSGTWNVCITTAPTQSVTQICQPVPAVSPQGVVFGNVIAGHTYSYSASGCVQRSSDNPNMADPDGNQYTNGCSAAQFVTNNVPAPAGATCPGLRLFSLVGKIDGGQCLQFGKGGDFVAPVTGQLVLYFNDDNYTDNSGSWDVCITDLPETIKCLALEGQNFRVTWTTCSGRIYVLQSSSSPTHSAFVDISPPIVTPVAGTSTTNFLDPSAVTGQSQRQYRVRVIH